MDLFFLIIDPVKRDRVVDLFCDLAGVNFEVVGPWISTEDMIERAITVIMRYSHFQRFAYMIRNFTLAQLASHEMIADIFTITYSSTRPPLPAAPTPPLSPSPSPILPLQVYDGKFKKKLFSSFNMVIYFILFYFFCI